MHVTDSLLAQFELNGVVVIPDILDRARCDALTSQIDEFESIEAGSRTLLDQAWCMNLAKELRSLPIIAAVLPLDSVAVQCTLFDKSPEKNWLVSLHQDLSIPVKSTVAAPGFAGWSEKEGRLFVQPPAAVLEQLVAVRVHIDDCPVDAGALRVVPESHAFGRLTAARAEQLRAERGEVAVPAARGGALIMRPLLLHASSKASAPQPRRVLHFVFGPSVLPCGVEWRDAV